MIRIGITGGIGSGKSVVASLLSVYNIPVYIADNESKKLTDTSEVIKGKLVSLFGNDIYNNNGLDRKLLAKHIFGNKEMLAKVNSIIHPEVNKHFNCWAESQKTKACAIESAILFESGFDKTVDVKLMVYAPKDIRIQRAIMRDGASREEIERRINSQMADEEKSKLADFTIINDGFSALIPQMENFLRKYDL